MGFFLAVVLLLVGNDPCHWTEVPGLPLLTVEFLLSLLAQLRFRNESGHVHHLRLHGMKAVYHAERETASSRSPVRAKIYGVSVNN